MSSDRKAQSFVLKSGTTLGMNSAEADDEFLFDCFIQTPAYEELTNFDSPKMIAAGRTGAGKTAILRAVERNFGKSIEIDPINISLDYVANSTILTFLQEVGADLDLLFQVVWKHVLCVEYIRLRYNVSDQSRWDKCIERLQSLVAHDARKAAALDYLRQYDGKFFIGADQNLKHMVENVKTKLATEFGGEYEVFKARRNVVRDLSVEKREEIVARCKRIVTPEQLTRLSALIGLLAEDEAHVQNKHYILIDRLDEQWIEDGLRFRMIRALIESLRRFRKIRRLKIIAALRSDVLERVVQENKALGFQKEKHDDYIFELRWTPVLLTRLVSERLQHLSVKKYKGQKLSWQELFPRKIGNQTIAAYIMDRTLHRPRDFLAYVNLCLQAAEGKSEVTASIVRQVEREYSIGRYKALIDEWRGTFPSLPAMLIYMARFETPVSVDNLIGDGKRFDDLVEDIYLNAAAKSDPMYACCEVYLSSPEDGARIGLLRELVCILYRIGVIGVRLSPESKVLYSHIDNPSLTSGSIELQSDLRIHPMFLPALKGSGMEGELGRNAA